MNPLKFKTFKKLIDHFREIYGIYLIHIKNTKDLNMQPIGLGNTRVLTDFAQKSPQN